MDLVSKKAFFLFCMDPRESDITIRRYIQEKYGDLGFLHTIAGPMTLFKNCGYAHAEKVCIIHKINIAEQNGFSGRLYFWIHDDCKGDKRNPPVLKNLTRLAAQKLFALSVHIQTITFLFAHRINDENWEAEELPTYSRPESANSRYASALQAEAAAAD